ncbi:MAG: hypothetical protein BZ136_06060 [Methanosphaera sp. rholeuAM74]|nr:MAG: hypothetical protein BZ136_06060 [Methanosphaera sp. rholeuAM74]
MSNKEISEKIIKLLDLDKDPVAIKMFKSEDDAKKYLPRTGEQMRHCEMVYKAAKEKEAFYSTVEEQSCPGGSTSLGLREGTLADDIVILDPIYNAIAYSPLESAEYEPDVIILYVNPLQALKFKQTLRKVSHKRYHADFTGSQSLCSDVVSKPILNNESNLSFGCNGSRRCTDIRDDELVMGLIMEDVKLVADQL